MTYQTRSQARSIANISKHPQESFPQSDSETDSDGHRSENGEYASPLSSLTRPRSQSLDSANSNIFAVSSAQSQDTPNGVEVPADHDMGVLSPVDERLSNIDSTLGVSGHRLSLEAHSKSSQVYGQEFASQTPPVNTGLRLSINTPISNYTGNASLGRAQLMMHTLLSQMTPGQIENFYAQQEHVEAGDRVKCREPAETKSLRSVQ